jgi:glycogen debranching enzyme
VDIKLEILRRMEILRSPDGWLKAGWPRFWWYCGRDAAISAWQMLPYQPSLAISTILYACRFQGRTNNPRTNESAGAMPHQIGSTKLWDRLLLGDPYYGAIDATPLWLVLVSELWRQEGSKIEGLLQMVYPNVSAALGWFRKRFRRNGFLFYRRHGIFGFTHQGWRDGYRNTLRLKLPVALVDVQAYAYAALRGTADIYREVYRDPANADILKREADELRQRFNDRFWWGEEGTYAFALAGENGVQVREIVPDPAMAVFSGIVSEERIRSVIGRVFAEDLWTPYGIRSRSKCDPIFHPASYHNGSIWPFVNWFIWKGCRLYGFTAEARMIVEAMLKAWQHFDAIPECYGATAGQNPKLLEVPHANRIQAWSLGALYDMLSA